MLSVLNNFLTPAFKNGKSHLVVVTFVVTCVRR